MTVYILNPILSVSHIEKAVNLRLIGYVLGAALLMCGLYKLIIKSFTRYSVTYGRLEHGKQKTLVQHVFNAVVLLLCLPPLTYINVSLQFQANKSEEETLMAIRWNIILMIVVMLTFIFDFIYRDFRMRWFLAMHHILALSNGMFTAFFMSHSNFKASSLLVYFATYEGLSYFALVMYRIYNDKAFAGSSLIAGVAIVGITRIIQVTWIIGSLATVWNNLILWHAIVQCIFTASFTIIQLYSLKIHYKLANGLLKKKQPMDKLTHGFYIDSADLSVSSWSDTTTDVSISESDIKSDTVP